MTRLWLGEWVSEWIYSRSSIYGDMYLDESQVETTFAEPGIKLNNIKHLSDYRAAVPRRSNIMLNTLERKSTKISRNEPGS
jgi:hypothetical protein